MELDLIQFYGNRSKPLEEYNKFNSSEKRIAVVKLSS